MDGERAGRGGDTSLPTYLMPGGLYLHTLHSASTLDELYSLLLLRRGGEASLFFFLFCNNSHAALLYYNCVLSCRKQRGKQQSQQPTQAPKPPELGFLLQDIPYEVSKLP